MVRLQNRIGKIVAICGYASEWPLVAWKHTCSFSPRLELTGKISGETWWLLRSSTNLVAWHLHHGSGPWFPSWQAFGQTLVLSAMLGASCSPGSTAGSGNSQPGAWLWPANWCCHLVMKCGFLWHPALGDAWQIGGLPNHMWCNHMPSKLGGNT